MNQFQSLLSESSPPISLWKSSVDSLIFILPASPSSSSLFLSFCWAFSPLSWTWNPLLNFLLSFLSSFYHFKLFLFSRIFRCLFLLLHSNLSNCFWCDILNAIRFNLLCVRCLLGLQFFGSLLSSCKTYPY